MKYYLAIDIGASSGRHIVGHKDASGEIVLDEVYRFNNWVQEKDGHLIWDIDALFLEVKRGIAEALKKYPRIESLSIDTWGVDYVLLDEDDKEIYPAYAYRDLRTEESIPEVHKILSKEKL
ncbi:MAG: rhamnulokinase, partial [Bacilli bacterium]|nr:rhamnulokinase [Bacilli bacterium]